MALRAPRRATAHADEAIGFVLFFTVVFLAVTVFCELTGRPALGWALTLLVCVLALVGLYRWRVALVRRAADATSTVDGRPASPGAAGAPARRDHATSGTGVRNG